jgi:perosamine synthetase
MDRFLELKIPIIEDCAQAVGARYRDQRVGTFGHAAIFSFYATKVITTGEGGMVVSSSTRLLERVRDLRAYDNKPDAALRFNYKMTDLQAALGLAQIERLAAFIQRRRDIAARYRRAFADMGCRLPIEDPGHIYYRYVIYLNGPVRPVIDRLGQEGIGAARPVFKPLHRYLNQIGYAVTERVWEQSLSIPIYPALSEVEIDRIVGSTRRILQESQS